MGRKQVENVDLRTRPLSVSLPNWVWNRLDELSENRSNFIYELLLEFDEIVEAMPNDDS